MVYRVREFVKCFESSESRKLKRLPWIALPTRQEGDGYTELMSGHENGCAHFGAWTAVLQLAAKCEPRGTLMRDLGGRRLAHDLASISRITRVPVEVLREAMPRLLEIGWMEEIAVDEVALNLPESPGTLADDGKKPGHTGEERRGTAQQSTGEGEDATLPPPASPGSNSGPSSPAGPSSPGAAKRRLDLLSILKAQGCTLDLGSENLFQEWVDVTDGHPLRWIEHLLSTSRPRLKLPSKLRAALKARAGEFQRWRAANPSAPVTNPSPDPTMTNPSPPLNISRGET